MSVSNKKKNNGKFYDKQFKVAAVKLVTEEGYNPKEAAKSLGVPPSTLQYWIKIYGQEPKSQAETTQSLRLQVQNLQVQVRRLLMEREILKKATAFFASQSL